MHPSNTRVHTCPQCTYFEWLFWPRTYMTSPMRLLLLTRNAYGLSTGSVGMPEMQVIWCSHQKLSPPTYISNKTVWPGRWRLSIATGWERRFQNGRPVYQHLYINTYSSLIWSTKLKMVGMSKLTVTSLKHIFYDYATPKSFMSDGGSHFNNAEVDDFCKLEQVQHIITPACTPWMNRLIENANQLLLGRLKRLCAPDHDNTEDTTDSTKHNPVPQNTWMK